MRINRNIVECKDQGKPDWAKVAKVLIETLWNVKFQDAWKKEGENTVLIETLWNVKFYDRMCAFSGHIVLIETLWNVKVQL